MRPKPIFTLFLAMTYGFLAATRNGVRFSENDLTATSRPTLSP